MKNLYVTEGNQGRYAWLSGTGTLVATQRYAPGPLGLWRLNDAAHAHGVTVEAIINAPVKVLV